MTMKINLSTINFSSPIGTPWSGEVKVLWTDGTLATHYPRIVESAMQMRRYYSADRKVREVRLIGPALKFTNRPDLTHWSLKELSAYRRQLEEQIEIEPDNTLLAKERDRVMDRAEQCAFHVNEKVKADADYDKHLQRRGITAKEHEQEIGEWIDTQD